MADGTLDEMLLEFDSDTQNLHPKSWPTAIILASTGVNIVTTPFSGEPLTAPTYPSILDEQLRALETDEWVQRIAESRRRLAATDPYRPLFHFSSPESYMNDPNGLCQWDGRYHMFYQFRPTAVDRVHWGHTVSDDLVRWRDMPPALYPGCRTRLLQRSDAGRV